MTALDALDALDRARAAWERTQPQQTFDPHILHPDIVPLSGRPASPDTTPSGPGGPSSEREEPVGTLTARASLSVREQNRGVAARPSRSPFRVPDAARRGAAA